MGERTWFSIANELELTVPPRTGDAMAIERLGRYELLHELGRGGMGQVLLAFDPEVGREVAIKVLLPDAAVDRWTLERFIVEARITGQLEHPNIVPVYDVGTHEDGRVYYVMKRVMGESLHSVLSLSAQDWGLPRLLGAFEDVCSAVAFAHHQGVIHQDLKPGNVMLGDFGEVLVLDWGLATLIRAGLSVENDPGISGVCGTPGYIAPERLARPKLPPRPPSDQWSLGAVLYLILCGRRPYPQAGREAMAATLAGPPLDVRLVDAEREVPDAIGEICMRALHADPRERFPDVAAMGEAVRAYLEGSERRAKAMLAVSEADKLLPHVQDKRRQAEQKRAEARALLEGVKGSDPVEKKAPAWDLQDAAAELERQAELDEIQRLGHLRGALERVPDLHAAHVRLALHHRAALEAAEARRDPVAAAREEWLLRRHDRGHHRRWLDRESRVTLITDPPGAWVTLARFAPRRRRLVEVEPRDLGVTPILELRLAPGSYMLTVQAEGHHAVRYPICVARGEDWTGVPPGASEPHVIALPKLGALGPEDVYVPAGWFIAGGDDQAPDSLSRRRVWVDAFVMRMHPVTNGEYLAFLNGLLEAGEVEAAHRHVPRDVTLPSSPMEGRPLFRWEAGRFGVPEDQHPRRWGRLPVVRTDLLSSRAYAAAQGPWGLPNELEWEKAARGVDARCFPWGDEHDPAFANMVSSQQVPQVGTVGAVRDDVSVYGVRDLGGNLRDRCDNRWTEAGPAQDGERLQPQPASLQADYVASRGGSFSSQVGLTRAATRFGDKPSTRSLVRGFRLTRRLSPHGEGQG